jgi:hypothetical protein
MKLVGYTEIDGALRRIDKVTQTEALTVAAQALDVAHRTNDGVLHVANDICSVDGRVKDIDGRVKNIDGRMKSLEGKMGHFRETLDSAQSYSMNHRYQTNNLCRSDNRPFQYRPYVMHS